MPKNAAEAPKMAQDRPAVLYWRDYPALRAAEQHLQRGQEAVADAEAQVTTLEAEVERARSRLHEALVARQVGDASEADVTAVRAALADTEHRLQQAREVADASRGALVVLQRRCDEAAARAREEVGRTLEAQRRALAERLGAVLAQVAAINRDLLRIEDLMRQNGLPVPEPLAWGELLPLVEPKVLRNRALTCDWAVGVLSQRKVDHFLTKS